jgi:hypothetical protein
LSATIGRTYRHPSLLSVLEGDDTAGALGLDHNVSLEATVPVNFSRGAWYRTTSLTAGYDFIHQQDLRSDQSLGNSGLNLHTAGFQGSLSITRKRAYQNISTPLGAGLELKINHSIGSTSAARYQGIVDLAVRGLFPNHNLLVSGGFKQELQNLDYRFTDEFLYPRGYQVPVADRMFTFQGTYHFPIAYPDLGFWGIFYCSRIRADLFADGGYASFPAGRYDSTRAYFASAGTEIILDSKWFNIAELPIGIRFSLLLSPDPEQPDNRFRWEFIIPVIRL